MGSQSALRIAAALLSLWLCLLVGTTHGQSIPTASNATASGNTTMLYLRMTWAETDIVRVTFAEPFVKTAIKSFLQNASEVRVIDIRESAFPMGLSAAMRSTFQVLFLVTTIVTNSTNSTVSTNATQQQGAFQSDALVRYLQQNLTTTSTTSGTSSPGDAGYNASTAVPASWAATFFPSSGIKFNLLSAADAQALGPFAALTQLSTPAASNASFMALDVVFRNIQSALSLSRGLIYQARQGITRFLQLPVIADIYTAGPAQVPVNAALQVVQRYYLVLSRNGSQSSSNNSNLTTTLENRERLTNLLIFGDPTRQLADFEANDGFFATSRASMFFDYILPANASLSSVSTSSTALDVLMMDALFSYTFSSLTVDQFPPGNPPAPSPISIATTIIPGVSNDVLMAKMRKRQRFLYNASFTTTTSGTSSNFPASVTYPGTVIQSNASSTCTMVNGFCTYIYWKNSLASTFWLESMESVNQVAWDLFPTVPFFAISDPVTTTLLAPIVTPGNTSTPIWTFGALSGPSNRLDFALNLRSADDNATALKVEISTDVRSSVEATSTITSIARDTTSSSSSNTTPVPIYETKSNIVVTYQSRFRNANEVFLFLEIKNSSATGRDTSQPCAHCQNLYEWCASQPKCAALSSCVFLQGIDRDQIPYQMLLTSPLQDFRELWPYFQNCMGSLDASVDLKAMLLLSNAVRCQMQRLCPFRTASYYGGATGTTSDSIDSKILIWESVEGRQQLKTQANNSHFPRDIPVNVSMRLGAQVLCYLPILSNTTADSFEDRIARSCKLAKYLGRVSVSVNMTGGTTSNASTSSYDTIDIRYKYIVGPLPTLEIVPPANSSNATVSVEVTTTAFPGIRLRLETKDFQSILPPAPATTPPDPCTKCNKLALDICLRDLNCVAFTDCIMRYPMDNASVPPLGDVILDTFRTQAVGKQISMGSAIDACHSSANVNQLEWRKLVNASACFSKSSCPISLQMLLPNSEKLVGKWRIDPIQKLQKLLYQQQDGEAPASDLQIPLVLVRNSEVVKTDSSSASDPHDFELKLRKLLEYDDLSVKIEFDRLQSNSGLRTIQWSISYSHWVGTLPRFLSDSSSPAWSLFTDPAQQQNFFLEMLNKTALDTDNGSFSNMASILV